MLKGIFKESHPLVQLLLVLAFVFSGAIAGQFIGIFVVFIKYGFSMEIVDAILKNLTEYASVIREIQFFSALGMFVFPALILAYLFSEDYKNYLKIDTPVSLPLCLWVVVSIVVSFPFLNFVAYYNDAIHFPEALKPLEDILRAQDEANRAMSKAMLNADSMWDLTMNIVVAGIFAAVGEEFVFRGILQRVFSRILRNKHVVIWTVALIFSLAHFQFFGLVPRLLLGAYFGYLVYFTKNIWIPVIAHFFNNFVIILNFWSLKDNPEALEAMDKVGSGSSWWVALVSLVLFALVFGIIRKQALRSSENFPA